MKLFKNYLPVVALAIALGTALAFGTKESKKTGVLTTVWFQYVGPQPADPSDAYDPNNWDEIPSAPDCPGEGILCAIGVEPSEIYVSGTYAGRPRVDDNNTDAYDALDEAWHSSGSGTWWDVTLGTSIVETTYAP